MSFAKGAIPAVLLTVGIHFSIISYNSTGVKQFFMSFFGGLFIGFFVAFLRKR